MVARGRHEGYLTVVVPGLMADAPDRDVLADSVHAQPPDAAPTVEVVSTSVGDLTIAYRVHRLGPADIHSPTGARGDGGDHAIAGADRQLPDAVTDAHGRPLDLFYGIVVPRAVAEVDEVDLRAAYDASLPVYRRFLTNERGFAPEPSHAIPLRSELVSVDHRTRSVPVEGVDREPVPAGRPRGARHAQPHRQRTTRRPAAVLQVVLLLVLLLGLAASVWTILRPMDPVVAASDVQCDPPSEPGTRTCSVELVVGDSPLQIDALALEVPDAPDPIRVDDACVRPLLPGETCVVRMDVPASVSAGGASLVIRSGDDALEVALTLP